MIQETITTTFSAKALAVLEPALRELAEGCWEDDAVQTELINFANDIASRLQRIATGDIQP